MKPTKVLGLAVLAALGLAVIPSILPTGPSTSLDATGLLDKGQLFVALGVIFLGGLLTALTPCVYPLIPITVGVFGARQADSRGRAFVLTTAYVFGMGAVFSALGVFAALSGKAFGSVLGNSWLVVGLAAFLVVLASSMFGAFELALPSSLATRLNTVGGGGIIGALLMGSVAGFLAAPCTGPVLTGVLAWVSRTQDPVLGALLLFVYALGIGVPFFLIGVFTVRLPKSGEWMEWVKSVFGIALLALAAAYLRDAFPAVHTFVTAMGERAGWLGGIGLAAVLMFVGVGLGAVHLSFKVEKQWLPKGLGVAVIIAGFVLRMAVPEQVAARPVVDGVVSNAPTTFQWAMVFKADEAKSANPFDQVLARAKADCKPVMIDFFADWCAACNELDHKTYPTPSVISEGERFVRVKVDGTNDHEVLDGLYARFGVQGLPTVAFVDPLGNVMQSPRVVGYLPADKFVTEMQKVVMTTCAK
jgi:thiol:disulfide interchange protein DsbD